MAPVDFVAAAMVKLSQTARSIGSVFHLCNMQSPRWHTVVEWLAAAGYQIEVASNEEWLRRIGTPERGRRSVDEAARQVLLLQAEQVAGWLSTRVVDVDSRNVLEGLAGSGIGFPVLTQLIFNKYLAFLAGVQFLPPPIPPFKPVVRPKPPL
jgi:hypothetical protein